MQCVSDLSSLLTHMHPVLNPGRYVFAALHADTLIDPARVVASVREPEGVSAVIPEELARDHGLPVEFVAAWITLAVQSDLAAVGLTAAVSQALTEAGISCNVVAGFHHDHVFVPVERSHDAMEVLRGLSRSANG